MALLAVRLVLLLLLAGDLAGNAHRSPGLVGQEGVAGCGAVSESGSGPRLPTPDPGPLAALRAPVTGGSRGLRSSRSANVGGVQGWVEPAMLFRSCLALAAGSSHYLRSDTLLSALSLLKQIFWSPRSEVGFLWTQRPH